MFEPKPFKDAEVNPEPPERDLRDYFELFLSFLWFHHKKIAGLILLIGVGYWINLVMKSPKQVDEGPRKPRTVQPDDIPVATLGVSKAKPKETTTPKNANRTTTESKPVLEPANAPAKAETVDELIQRSLELGTSWGQARPSIGIVLCAERASISQKLLAKELTDSQRKYALVAYVDSIGLVDSLNVAGQMNLPGTREAIQEIDNKYSSHEDDVIAAKANLAVTLAPLYDFLRFKKEVDLQKFQQLANNRMEKIAADQSSLARLADLAIALQTKAPGKLETTRPVAINLLKLIQEVDQPYAALIGELTKERLLFVVFDPATLATRVHKNDDSIRDQVQGFFKTLSQNPDSSESVYQIAVDVILAYRRIGNNDDVMALVNWLDQISNEMTIPNNQNNVKKAIETIRKEISTNS